MNKRRSVSSKTCPVKCDAKGIEAAMLNGQQLCVCVCVCDCGYVQCNLSGELKSWKFPLIKSEA